MTLKNLDGNDRLMAFRYHDLILLKNYSGQNVSVRGRPLVRGGFCRIYPGQRILGWQSGAQLSGAGAIFQREEECFASADFHPCKQGLGRSGTGALADARKLAPDYFRIKGAASKRCAMSMLSSTE